MPAARHRDALEAVSAHRRCARPPRRRRAAARRAPRTSGSKLSAREGARRPAQAAGSRRGSDRRRVDAALHERARALRRRVLDRALRPAEVVDDDGAPRRPPSAAASAASNPGSTLTFCGQRRPRRASRRRAAGARSIAAELELRAPARLRVASATCSPARRPASRASSAARSARSSSCALRLRSARASSAARRSASWRSRSMSWSSVVEPRVVFDSSRPSSASSPSRRRTSGSTSPPPASASSARCGALEPGIERLGRRLDRTRAGSSPLGRGARCEQPRRELLARRARARRGRARSPRVLRPTPLCSVDSSSRVAPASPAARSAAASSSRMRRRASSPRQLLERSSRLWRSSARVQLGRLRLALQRAQPRARLALDVQRAVEVVLRALELELRAVAALAVLAEPGRLLDQRGPVRRLRVDDLLHAALADDRVHLLAEAAVREHLQHVDEPAARAVQPVDALARAVDAAREIADLRELRAAACPSELSITISTSARVAALHALRRRQRSRPASTGRARRAGSARRAPRGRRR